MITASDPAQRAAYDNGIDPHPPAQPEPLASRYGLGDYPSPGARHRAWPGSGAGSRPPRRPEPPFGCGCPGATSPEFGAGIQTTPCSVRFCPSGQSSRIPRTTWPIRWESTRPFAPRDYLQKYHGRALLITTSACAVHCRYCFRREFPYCAADERVLEVERGAGCHRERLFDRRSDSQRRRPALAE